MSQGSNEEYETMKQYLKIAGVVLLLLAVYSVFQLIFSGLAIAIYLFRSVMSGAISIDMLENVEALMENPAVKEASNEALALGLFLSAAAMLLFIHLTKLFRLRWSLLRSIAFRPLLYSTLLVFTSMIALNIFVQWLPLENILENEFDGLTHTFLGAFTISLMAPVLEEVMFRGAMQGYMIRKLGNPWQAIAIAALVFGVFHMNPVQIVYASLFGLVLGWIYYRTGSLMSVIVGHVLNNTIATFMMLSFGNVEESELMAQVMPREAVLVSETVMFVLFGGLSLMLASKLHRSMPAPPVPWRESDEVGQTEM